MGRNLLIGRRELAELGDGGGDYVQGEFDVGGRGVTAEAEAKAGAGFFGRQTDRSENVRGLDGAGRAGGPGGTGQTFQVERNKEGFAFDAGEDKICGVRSAGCSGGVDARLGNALEEALLQSVAKSGDAQSVFYQRLARDFCGFAKSNDSGDVFRAGTEAGLVMSAIQKLSQTRSAAAAKRAESLWSVQFVPGVGG